MSLTKTIIDLVKLSGTGSEVKVTRDVIDDDGRSFQLQITANELVTEYVEEDEE
jgi:hypothetical protein